MLKLKNIVLNKPLTNLLSEETSECTTAKDRMAYKKEIEDLEDKGYETEKPTDKAGYKIRKKTITCGNNSTTLYKLIKIKKKEDDDVKDKDKSTEEVTDTKCVHESDIWHIGYLIIMASIGSGTHGNDLKNAFLKIKTKADLIRVDNYINEAFIWANNNEIDKYGDGYFRKATDSPSWYEVPNIQKSCDLIITLPVETAWGVEWYEEKEYSNLSSIIQSELDNEPDNWGWWFGQSLFEVKIRNIIMDHIVKICGDDIKIADGYGISWGLIDGDMPSANGDHEKLYFGVDNDGTIVGTGRTIDTYKGSPATIKVSKRADQNMFSPITKM